MCQRHLSETFNAQTSTGETLYFSKRIAEEQAQGKQAHVIPPTLLNFLAFRNQFVEQHVAHVAEIQTPGIVVFSGRRVILIDGTHRAVSALRARWEFTASAKGRTKISRAAKEPLGKDQRASKEGYLLVTPQRRTSLSTRDKRTNPAIAM